MPTSDWDLLVLVPDSTEEEKLEPELAWKIQQGTGVYADVIPMRSSEYRGAVDVAKPLRKLF